MELIEDLGVMSGTDNQRRRMGLYKCMECDSIYTRVISVQKRSITGLCKSCSSRATGLKQVKHGLSATRLNSILHGMEIRCYKSEGTSAYKSYQGKGITICKEWRNNISVFHEWAINNGYADNLTIDRKDSNKGYSPENCHWITHSENNNKVHLKMIPSKVNIMIEMRARGIRIKDIARELQVSVSTIEKNLVKSRG